MADIFISYTRTDGAIASKVAAAFERQGCSVFFDNRISPGESWDQRIESELDTARAVVVLWSADSRDRVWVRNEARFALNKGTLCPALIGSCEIPIEFSHLQTVDLRDWGGSDTHPAFQALLQASTKKAPPRTYSAPQPSRLPAHLEASKAEELKGVATSDDFYDLNLLHAKVREAVERARAAQRWAIEKAFEGRYAAELAAQAAERARAGAPGTCVFDYGEGDAKQRYEGEGVGSVAHGYGWSIACYTDDMPGTVIHDAGQWQRGKLSGVGQTLIIYPPPSKSHFRWEGELSEGKFSGSSALWVEHKLSRAGEFLVGESHGYSVFHGGSNHQRYEGLFHNKKRHGFGVEWRQDGSVFKAGIWADDELRTVL